MMNLVYALIFAAYLLFINGLALLLFDIDKRAAQSGKRRISESSLLYIALIGGSPGSLLAQRTLRHKTKKQPFKIQLYLIVGAQLLMLIAMCMPSVRIAAFGIVRNL